MTADDRDDLDDISSASEETLLQLEELEELEGQTEPDLDAVSLDLTEDAIEEDLWAVDDLADSEIDD